MYCDNCGEKRIADESYCHNCGKVFESGVKKEKKDNKFLKWILWIIIAIVVIYASLVVGKMIGNNENDSQRNEHVEEEHIETKQDVDEQDNKVEAPTSKMGESIKTDETDVIPELEAISDKLKEDIIKHMNSFKKDSEEDEEE